MTQTISIDGITYEVVKRVTVEDEISEGRHNTARSMQEMKQAAQLYLKRPKGSVMFYTVEFENGRICGNPARLGRWS